jgi:hypothetical protein
MAARKNNQTYSQAIRSNKVKIDAQVARLAP